MVEWVKIGIIGGGLFIVLAIGSFVYHYLKEKKEEKKQLGFGQPNQYGQYNPNPYHQSSTGNQGVIGYNPNYPNNNYPIQQNFQPHNPNMQSFGQNPIQVPINQPIYDKPAKPSETAILSEMIKLQQATIQAINKIPERLETVKAKNIEIQPALKNEITAKSVFTLKLPEFADNEVETSFRERLDKSLEKNLEKLKKKMKEESLDVEISYEVENADM